MDGLLWNTFIKMDYYGGKTHYFRKHLYVIFKDVFFLTKREVSFVFRGSTMKTLVSCCISPLNGIIKWDDSSETTILANQGFYY